MARPPELDRENLINTIWKYKGKITPVAQDLGVTTVTIYAYAKKYATVQTAIDEAREMFDEMLLDTAERGLMNSVNKEHAWAVKYTLSTKGKSRGYVERQEVTGADGEKLDINVTLTSNDS